jgi:hypothetical protein
MTGNANARGLAYAVGLFIAALGFIIEALELGVVRNGILTLHPIDLKQLAAWLVLVLSNGVALRAWWKGLVGRAK